jgi:hypothetical protein
MYLLQFGISIPFQILALKLAQPERAVLNVDQGSLLPAGVWRRRGEA